MVESGPGRAYARRVEERSRDLLARTGGATNGDPRGRILNQCNIDSMIDALGLAAHGSDETQFTESLDARRVHGNGPARASGEKVVDVLRIDLGKRRRGVWGC